MASDGPAPFLTPVSRPEEVWAVSRLVMSMAEPDPARGPGDPSGFLSPDRLDRMLSALHDLGWRPLHTDADGRYLRWCDWPDCLRSYNILDGPEPGRDGVGWKHRTRGSRVLLCPDHASTEHWPGTFRWERGETVIGMSCGCGESVEGLSPTTHERCVEWWREHVRSLP